METTEGKSGMSDQPLAAQPVAEVVWYDPRLDIFPDREPHKIIDASLAFFDEAPIGTKLYLHPDPRIAKLEADLAAAQAEVGRLSNECDAIAELNHAQYLALENCRLLAARHRNDETWQHILRFCDEGGIRAIHIRQANGRDSARADAAAMRVVTPEMVKAYLDANDEYWRIQDAQALPPMRWRKGTPQQATEYSLTKMFAAIDQARKESGNE